MNVRGPQLSHSEDHGKALILKEKRLTQDPGLSHLGLAPSPLCHTASPSSPSPTRLWAAGAWDLCPPHAFPGHDQWLGQIMKAAWCTRVSNVKPWVWVLILFMYPANSSRHLYARDTIRSASQILVRSTL